MRENTVSTQNHMENYTRRVLKPWTNTTKIYQFIDKNVRITKIYVISRLKIITMHEKVCNFEM